MRIEKVCVRNYRSIRDLELTDLATLSVIFGQNSVGKSNLLRAINLILVKAPRAARARDIVTIPVDDETHPMHFGGTERDPEICIELTRRSERLSTQIGNLEVTNEQDRDLLRQAAAAAVERSEGGQVQIQICGVLRVLDEEAGTVFVEYERIVFGELEIFLGGVFQLRGDPSKGTQVQWASDFLRLVTAGFILIDCPRLLSSSETLVYPPADTSNAEMVDWTSRLPQNAIINKLAWADRTPTIAKRLRALEEHLARRHGTPTVSEERVKAEDGSVYSRLRLFITDPPDLEGLSHTANASGTGFAQLLHVLAPIYLQRVSVLAIEELEANLSPRSQRWIWDELGTLLRDQDVPLEQLLTTSHSPSFMRKQARETQVWYASLIDGATSIQRLGSDDDVRRHLQEHFEPLHRSIWSRLGAVSWVEVPSGSYWALFSGSENVTPQSDPTLETFSQILGSNSEDLVRLVRVVKATPKSRGGLVEALALDDWLRNPWRPELLMLEWIQSSARGQTVRVRIEGKTEDGVVTSIVLWTEAVIPRDFLADNSADVVWRRSREELVSLQRNLLEKLSAE